MTKGSQTTEEKKLSKMVVALQKEVDHLANCKKKAVLRRSQEKRLKPYQAELIRMQKYLEKSGRGMIIIFEGRDAAGKGGTIRRVARYMNEKHYRVVALGKPTEQQKTQWYFQRYVEELPRAGEVVLFDRSWYNRAMVEPVLGFCTNEQYKTFQNNVAEFEKMLTDQGILIVKLYFSVTKDEQAKRFARRKNDPLRNWKLSEVDMQAQKLWGDFTKRKYEMLCKSHTVHAPWKIIRSNDKFKARLNAMRVILNAVPYKKQETDGVTFVPNHRVVISGALEIEQMEAQLLEQGEFIA